MKLPLTLTGIDFNLWRSRKRRIRPKAGSALIVVLAMVVLLTGLLLAFLSRSLLEHQISTSSSSQTKADLFAQGAVDTIIGDLKQEIVAGSTATTVAGGSTLYRPTAWATSVPAIVGFTPNNSATQLETDGFNNLLKISAYNAPFYSGANYSNTPAAPQRASAASTTTPSLNYRSISTTSWNEPLLIPSSAVKNFPVPDWILVARDGSNPTAWNTSLRTGTSTTAVVGRYAYAIYNEGGLLDMNVAGSPMEMTPSQMQNKSALAFADLTQIGLSGSEIDAITGWRNYASAESVGTFPSYTFTPAGLLNYFNNILTDNTGFLTVNNSNLPTVNNSTPYGGTGQSDQVFGSRQQLIQFLTEGVNPSDKDNLQNALQYMGTFSRVLDQPSYFPDPKRPTVWAGAWPIGTTTFGIYNTSGVVNKVAGNSAYQNDNAYNPAFRTITALTSFTRNDGSTAVVGEPLVKKRFALNHLAWLTYKGPSASNMSDPIVQNLIALMGGNPSNANDPVTAFVAQGTVANIYKYFGLTWTTDPNNSSYSYWVYDHGFIGSSAGTGTSPEPIGTLALVQAANPGREPDFFELLKASIHAGALGYSNDGIGTNGGSFVSDVVNQQNTQVDTQVIQIGANIINQFWPDNYPAWIVVNYGTKAVPVNASFWGKVDLPYFYGCVDLGVLVREATPKESTGTGADQAVTTPATLPTLSDPGQVADLQVPIIWNPHYSGMPSLAGNASPASLRICISNFNDPEGNSVAAGFSNFYTNVYPWSPDDGPPGQQTLSGMGIGVNNNVEYWNVGAWDSHTGTIIMPAKNAADNTALYFNNNSTLYREPTPLMQNSAPSASMGLSLDPGNIMFTMPYTGTNAQSYTASGIPEEGGANSYLGFYKGSAAQRWDGAPVPNGAQTTTTRYTVTSFGSHEYGCTISLEYQSGSSWIPYHQLIPRGYGNVDSPAVAVNLSGVGNNQSVLSAWGSSGFYGLVEFDPRSRRWFGSESVLMGGGLGTAPPTIATYNPNPSTNQQPRNGFYLGEASRDMYNSTYLGGGASTFTYSADTTTPGSATGRIVRRAVGAYVPGGNLANTSVGMPLMTVQGNSTNQYNRPIILHRPFRSVAELGYVFSDTPWKNIDFFTPESGYAGMLDVFCINDDTRPDALVAGRVDLNTRQPLVLQAILAGANRDEMGVDSPSTLSQTEAAAVAQALVLRTTNTTNPTKGNGPLYNVADLVGRYGAGYSNGALSPAPYDGFSGDLGTLALYKGGTANNLVPRFLETTMRALSDTGQAGTWNLMIDVVAQTGRYPVTATGLDNFSVEGQRRYWVHLAIDRQTGQVIDQQTEAVSQ